MASPFEDFPNVRLAWQRPTGAPADLREGLAAPTETVAIEGYLTGDGVLSGASTIGAAPITARAMGLPNVVAPGSRSARVYVIRWALVPSGDEWLDVGTGWAWTATGLRPDGLTAGEQELQLYLGPLAALPTPGPGTVGTAVIDQVNGPSGDGGVGALLREEVGDQLFITLRLPR
jgi:hypothetical protein